MANDSIKRVAVIGAGTMGSQIAAVIANAGIAVLLLDIVPEGAPDRDILAKKAAAQLRNPLKTLISEEKFPLIETGNVEDDLDRLMNADWVIECVPENLQTKHEIYNRISSHLKESAIVSSNTSTLPLAELKRGLEGGMAKRLCVTHFFNPPAKLPLLELASDQHNDLEAINSLSNFASGILGRKVVPVKDSPGFIANRIGIFWIVCAIEEALKEDISIETADAVMNGAFGFPKTGVFGLADFIGLRLVMNIINSMGRLLPENDYLQQLQAGKSLIAAQIEKSKIDGAKAGFYHKEGDVRQVLGLKSGEYKNLENPRVEIEHWHEFLKKDAPESRFALRTLTRMLAYTERIAADIADNIVDIDTAMQSGYGWEYGPFEMIDRLGTAWLIEQMEKQGLHPPALLKLAETQGFYYADKERLYMAFDGSYKQPENMALKLIN
jgi:3-hydroxyacyl-CoA dehydrogenase